ncbi:MAG: hypothetical protein KAG10_02685 [Methylococcales bacterium]|nr:hypothetical protein [Methylococcales bacterium]MCK5924779.1 hypothetical protein [Methylococcales bacterium]
MSSFLRKNIALSCVALGLLTTMQLAFSCRPMPSNIDSITTDKDILETKKSSETEAKKIEQSISENAQATEINQKKSEESPLSFSPTGY